MAEQPTNSQQPSQKPQGKKAEDNSVRVEIFRSSNEVPFPFYAHDGDAGMDLPAFFHSGVDHVILAPGEAQWVPTGVSVDIPDGHFGMVVPRSGRSVKRPFIIPNSPATIDPGFQAEICVAQRNVGEGTAQIDHGERIAQLIIVPFAKAKLSEVAKFSRSTQRGESGYGSTGK